MKNLFYTIEIHYEEPYEEFRYLTGWKTIYVYKIRSNNPFEIIRVDATLEDNTEEKIRESLTTKQLKEYDMCDYNLKQL